MPTAKQFGKIISYIMKGKLPEPEEINTNIAFHNLSVAWRLIGMDCPPEINVKIYRVYGILLNFFITFLYPLSVVSHLLFTQTLQELCENLTMALADVIASLKVLNVFVARKKIKTILKIVQELDKRVITKEERLALQAAVNTAQTIFRSFTGLCFIGFIVCIIKVCARSERNLIFPAWFYIDWRTSDSAYGCIIFYQCFGLVVKIAQTCANDSYPSIYLIVLTGHMRALELRIRRIGFCQNQNAEFNQNALLDCIKDHNKILQLHKVVQETVSNTILGQFVGTVTIQCVAGLHFLYNVDDKSLSAQFLSMIFFIFVTMDTSIICYFGHQMRIQSELLLDAYYSCNWMDGTTKFRRLLIIPLQCSQQPSIIYAIGNIKVDLVTFFQMMKYTYSTFTLLMRLK